MLISNKHFWDEGYVFHEESRTGWTGYSHATVKQLSQSSAFRKMFCFTSLLLHQWSFTCEPNQVHFLPLSQQLLYLPHSQLTAFLLPGSQGAAEHMFHVSAASSGKRIHSPTEFTCYLETYSGQCSNLWLHKSHHPTLRKPRTSMTCPDPTVLPKQIIFLWMLHFPSPALTQHLHQLLLARKHTNGRSLPKRAVSSMWLGFKWPGSPLHAAPPLDSCLLSDRHPVLVLSFPSLPLLCLAKSPPNKQECQFNICNVGWEQCFLSISIPSLAAISTNHRLMWEGARNSLVIMMFAWKWASLIKAKTH